MRGEDIPIWMLWGFQAPVHSPFPKPGKLIGFLVLWFG